MDPFTWLSEYRERRKAELKAVPAVLVSPWEVRLLLWHRLLGYGHDFIPRVEVEDDVIIRTIPRFARDAANAWELLDRMVAELGEGELQRLQDDAVRPPYRFSERELMAELRRQLQEFGEWQTFPLMESLRLAQESAAKMWPRPPGDRGRTVALSCAAAAIRTAVEQRAEAREAASAAPSAAS
jgi:hypothetical protein